MSISIYLLTFQMGAWVCGCVDVWMWSCVGAGNVCVGWVGCVNERKKRERRNRPTCTPKSNYIISYYIVKTYPRNTIENIKIGHVFF